MVIKVKNINGTGKNARKITGSWLNFWEEQTGRKADKCLAYDKYNAEKNTVSLCGDTKSLVGGHVKKIGTTDNKWYILPICNSHNQIEKEFWAKEDDLVLATVE